MCVCVCVCVCVVCVCVCVCVCCVCVCVCVSVEFHGVWENLVYDTDIKEKVCTFLRYWNIQSPLSPEAIELC